MTLSTRHRLLALRYKRALAEWRARQQMVESAMRSLGITPGSAEPEAEKARMN